MALADVAILTLMAWAITPAVTTLLWYVGVVILATTNRASNLNCNAFFFFLLLLSSILLEILHRQDHPRPWL